MKRTLLAMMAIAFAETADAGTRETVLRKYAEVLATAELCPDVEANTVLLGMTAITFGLHIDRGSKDFDELNALAISKMHDDMEGQSVEAVCAAGRYLYGAEGVSGKNLLLDK